MTSKAIHRGEWLKRQRQKLNLYRTDLADKAELDPRTIQRAENGENTGTNQFFAILSALGVSNDEFAAFFGENKLKQ